MPSPSYHYKSPEELRKEIQKRSKSPKSRRRALLIIFVDLLISGMVLAALFYGGFLGTKKLKSTQPIETKDLQISASLEFEKNEFVLYLYVENKTKENLHYPASKHKEHNRVLFFLESKKPSDLQEEPSQRIFSLATQLSFPLELKDRRLEAGQTTIYRQEILLPSDAKVKTIRLELSEGSIILGHHQKWE